MISFARYVGIPYAPLGRTGSGVDCWGLVRLIYERELGIELPSYVGQYADPDAMAEVAALVAGEKGSWLEVSRGTERLLDVVVLRWLGEPCHVGVVVERGQFIHQWKQVNTSLAWYEGPRKAWRLDGIFRHRMAP